MYWYNPKSRTSERVAAPDNDDETVRMLAGHPDSARFVSGYAELRRSGAPIERSLALVGHEERLREHELAPMRLARGASGRGGRGRVLSGTSSLWRSASKKKARTAERGTASE